MKTAVLLLLRPAAEYGGAGAMVAALVAVVVATVLIWAEQRRRGRALRLPPGPWGLPVIGNLLELVGRSGELPHRAMARLSSKYGPIFFLKLGKVPTIVISDCVLAKACLSGNNDKIFASRPAMEATQRLKFGEYAGMAMTPYCDEWRQARKLCSLQLFTARRVSQLEPIRRDEIMAMLCRIKQHNGQIVNLTEALGSLTESMTCMMLLGKPLADIGSADDGRTPCVNMKLLVQRLTQLFQIPIIGDFIPALGFLDRSTKAALDEVHADFDLLFSKLIRDRQQPPVGAARSDSPQVILDVLLDNVDTERAKSIMMDLISASIDTSATALDWAMAELVGCPEAMERLREEVEGVGKGEDRLIEEAELSSLPYLKAVLKETMRLHAPVPLLVPHMATQECSVGGYRIPKGSTLLMNAWAMGQDPRSWPVEPQRFRPDRFLSAEGALIDFRGQHFELLPFGSGRRMCPGLPLALPLMESTLANLVYSFRWSLPPTHSLDLSERFGSVVCRAHPLFVIPHVRHEESH